MRPPAMVASSRSTYPRPQASCRRRRTARRSGTLAMNEGDSYLKEAASWDADREAHRRQTLRTTRWAACAGWVCAVAATAAILVMSPLKQTQPFLIRVDSSTGVVDTVPVFVGSEPMPQALTRHLLNVYVTTC